MVTERMLLNRQTLAKPTEPERLNPGPLAMTEADFVLERREHDVERDQARRRWSLERAASARHDEELGV